MLIGISQSNNNLKANNINSCVELSGNPENSDELVNMLEQGRKIRNEGEEAREQIISASEVKNTENNIELKLV